YDYGPENKELAVAGPEMLGDVALTNHYIMDPIACGNPIGWSIKTIGSKLTKMLDRAGYPAIAKTVKLDAVRQVLPEVEACAREVYATKRNTVKHNRGTDIFECGNFRFGLEMRRLPMGDGGLAIHVLADIGGTPGKAYTEETEMLAFDHFWNGAHYHYGPRNKNHRIYWDRTLVEDIGAAVVLHGVALRRIDLAGAGLDLGQDLAHRVQLHGLRDRRIAGAVEHLGQLRADGLDRPADRVAAGDRIHDVVVGQRHVAQHLRAGDRELLVLGAVIVA